MVTWKAGLHSSRTISPLGPIKPRVLHLLSLVHVSMKRDEENGDLSFYRGANDMESSDQRSLTVAYRRSSRQISQRRYRRLSPFD